MSPQNIHYRSSDNTVVIQWDDGAESVYDTRTLRGWCPCAICQGHFAKKLKFIENDGPGLEDARPVGSYGVCFVWSDGHSTGIYTFRDLRALADEGPPGEQPSRS